MIEFEIKKEGLLRVLKVADRIEDVIKDTLNLASAMVRGKAKEYAPVDKGILRASITGTPARKTSEGYVAVVGTNVEYAPYQEFGTGIYAGRGYITPKRKKFLAWFDRNQGKYIFARKVSGVKPKKYFGKAKEYLYNNSSKIISILFSKIKEYAS